MWVIKFTNSVYPHVSPFRNKLKTLHKYSCGSEFTLKLKTCRNISGMLLITTGYNFGLSLNLSNQTKALYKGL